MLAPVPPSTLQQRIAAHAEKLRSGPHRSGIVGDPLESALDGMADFLTLGSEMLEQARTPLSPQEAQLIAAGALRSVLKPLVDGVSRRVNRATIGVLVAALAGMLAIGMCMGWHLRGPAGSSWAAMASGATCGPASSDGWRLCPAVIFTK